MNSVPSNPSGKLPLLLATALLLTCNPAVLGWLAPGQAHGAALELSWLVTAGCASASLWLLLSGKSLRTLLGQGDFNLFLFIFGLLALFITNPLWVGKIQWLRAAAALGLILQLLRTFVLGVVRNEGMPRWLKNGWLALLSVAVLFLLAEIVFMFVPLTVGSTASLSSRLWFEKYWTPINEAGYRDAALGPRKSKKKILVVGDSFPAGQGIENAADRFPDLLGMRLPPDWTVYNLGECGADVSRNFENLRSFPESPDVVILSWYLNDIEGAAARAGFRFDARDLEGMVAPLRFVMLRSYFLNYLYSRRPFGHDFGYGEWLNQVVNDERVKEFHRQDLKQIVDYCAQKQVPLLVVFFPVLSDPAQFQSTLTATRDWIGTQGAIVLDLTKEVAAMSRESRTVNANDDHPGEALHAKVAQQLMTLLQQHSLLN